MNRPKITKINAFTLIELLVVISIIAVLLSILIPALAEVKERSRLIVCRSNLHQLGVATVTYSLKNNGRFYPGNFWNGIIIGVWEHPDYTGPGPTNYGYLLSTGEIELPSSNKHVIYCPSWRQSLYDPSDTNPGFKASWGITALAGGYDYRDSLDGGVTHGTWSFEYELFEGARSERIATRVIMSDWLHGAIGGWHDRKYNYILGDGSAHIYNDRIYPDKNYNPAGGLGEIGLTNYIIENLHAPIYRDRDYLYFDALDYLLGLSSYPFVLLEGEADPPPIPWR